MSLQDISANKLREDFLDFFAERGHERIPSALLIPENDPTVLFTTAGMHPLVPYLLGETHPQGKRLCDVQICVRTDDIEEVGDNTHHTFFEMLGNWSLGDYWKEDAIKWSYEFLTEILNLSHDRLAITCFSGNGEISRDEESAQIWKDLGFSENRIVFLSDNWWGPAGQTGPCGPDTEMFYWTGEGNAPDIFDTNDTRWVEIWNDVFMQYNKTVDGKFEILDQKNVDTGMGLERVLAILLGESDNYKSELFWPIIQKLEEISSQEYSQNKQEFRIISDHMKAATFMIAEGLEPSNKLQGYVLRRLIRRSIVKANSLGITRSFTAEISNSVATIYKDIYPLLDKNLNLIIENMDKEETKFRRTLDHGLKEFEKVSENISGETLFNLYQTYGFPLELSLEVASERGIDIAPQEIKEFQNKLVAHQELSRTSSAGMFKGGLADQSEQTTRLHTAAHLLLVALKRVLGEHVEQKGSNITAERLRFDFSHLEKMTPEQIAEVEAIVNTAISMELPVTVQEMTIDEAKNRGVHGSFFDRYGEKVKVYTIGLNHSIDKPSTIPGSQEEYFSREICGGPHVNNTRELGKFKIIKEESSSSGVRRIKAVLESQDR